MLNVCHFHYVQLTSSEKYVLYVHESSLRSDPVRDCDLGSSPSDKGCFNHHYR